MSVEYGPILDVMRQLRADGHQRVASNVRMTLEAFSSGSVTITRDGKEMGRAGMDGYMEWATGHLERVGEMDTPATDQAFINIGTTIVRGVVKNTSLGAAMEEPLTEGISVQIKTRKGGKEVAAPAKRQQRLKAGEEEPFQPPEIDPELETAPELPAPVGGAIGRQVYGYAIAYEETHSWWKGAGQRPRRWRGKELDELLDVCEPFAISRGWVAKPANKGVEDALEALEGVEFEGEAIVRPAIRDKPAAYLSDMLWRISSKGQYYAARRKRFLYPEEYCALYGWPMEHSVFDNLAAEGASTERVLWALTQGVMGTHASLMAAVAWAVNGAAGERVKAEFRGVGLNTVAMVWDAEKGSDSWDYVACYEGNPHVRWMHDTAWGTRHRCLYPKAEVNEVLPDGASINTSVISMRCQPWSYQNQTGIDNMEPAMSERYAAYKAVGENKPNVIIDEMLCRSWHNGMRIGWTRVEFLRDLALPCYCWAIVDCEAGNVMRSLACSHREIVIGVLPEYKEIMENELVKRGYKKVPRGGGGARSD